MQGSNEQEGGGGDMNFWKGLFEWSMKYQSDGTSQTQGSLSESDKEWLEEALKGAMVDLGKRLEDIKESLDGEGSSQAPATIEEKEQLLDELLDLVESIDQAKDLSSIGGLSTLLHVLDSGIPSLQWRAAEVIATCAQNNPEVQTSFFHGGVMDPVWALLDSEDDTCQLKALLGISCLIRGSSELHGYFSEHSGVSKLVKILEGRISNAPSAATDRIVRKCLQILKYAIDSSSVDTNQARQCSSMEPILSNIIGNKDENNDVALAALDLIKTLGLSHALQDVGS
jgi:hsp70-interacting protein